MMSYLNEQYFHELVCMSDKQRRKLFFGQFNQSTEAQTNHMDQYKEFCRLRDSRKCGAEVPQYTEAEAFAMVAIQAAAGELAFLAARHEYVMDSAYLLAREFGNGDTPLEGAMAFRNFASVLAGLKETHQLIALQTLASMNSAKADESVDTPEFQELLTWFHTACADPYSNIETRAVEQTRQAIISHLTTWGAQQREAGRLQGRAQRDEAHRKMEFMKNQLDQHQSNQPTKGIK
jgi:hypothetical protein